MLKPTLHELPTIDPLAIDSAVQYRGDHENRGHYGLLAMIALAAGRMLTGDLKPKGTYREIFNPVTLTREYRARRNWIDQLL